VSDRVLIFILCLVALLQLGILAVAHVSAHRLFKRMADRLDKAADEERNLGDVGVGR